MSTTKPLPSFKTTTDFPAVYGRANSASLTAQRRFVAAVGIGLSLGVAAAVFGAVDAEWAGWAGAASFACGAIIGALAITQHLERTWYDGRALAESVKSLTWLYA